MYFIKKVPSQGVWICYEHKDEEYQIAIMRWTDGLNQKVEEAVYDDADRIVTCLNYFEGTPTENIKLFMKNNKALHSDHEHPAVSNDKSAKEIQKGYSDYLRAHRGR